MLLFLILCLGGEPVTIVHLKECFAIPTRGQAARTPSGAWVYLGSDQTLMRRAPDGTESRIAGAGNGPGELQVPLAMGLDGVRPWVLDPAYGIKRFAADGQPVQGLRKPGLSPWTFRTGTGWVSLAYPSRRDPHAVLTAFDPDLQKPRTLWEDTVTWLSAKKTYRRMPSSVPYNPVEESLFFAVSPDGAEAYLLPPGPSLRIHVVSTVTGKTVRVLTRPEKPLPFDEAWGDRKIKELNQAGGARVTLDAPEVFPIVRAFQVDPWGSLILEKWTQDDTLARAYLVLDAQGAPREPAYPPALASRILAVNGRTVYLSWYDPAQDCAAVLETDIDHLAATCRAFETVDPKPAGGWIDLAP